MSITNKQKIFLNASEIASFINQNDYDYITPFERLWKKTDIFGYTDTFNKLNNTFAEKKIELDKLKETKLKLEDDLKSKVISKSEYNKLSKTLLDTERNVKQDLTQLDKKIDSVQLSESEQISKALGQDLVETIKNVTIDTESKRKETNKMILDLNLDETSKKALLKQTESFINKSHGTIKEDSAIVMFEAKYNVKLDTSQVYNKIQFKETDKYTYFIGGKVDGFYPGDSKTTPFVVEVKNRVKGLFNSLRDYEKTQIQIYIYMLNIEEARLVEKYRNAIRVTKVLKDVDYIDNIKTYLEIFIKNFERFIDSDSLKLKYLHSSNDQKKVFLKQLYLSEIAKKCNEIYEQNIIQQEGQDLESDLDDF
jgi:hypothetical protein